MQGKQISAFGALLALAVAAGIIGAGRSGQNDSLESGGRAAASVEPQQAVDIEIREFRFRADTVRVPLGASS